MDPDVTARAAPNERLVDVVYELLDANVDLAAKLREAGLEDDPAWAVELDYVRELQRAAREQLAWTASGWPS